jgi:hypothetical protein
VKRPFRRRCKRPIAVSLTGGLARLVPLFHLYRGFQRISAGFPVWDFRKWHAWIKSTELHEVAGPGALEIILALAAGPRAFSDRGGIAPSGPAASGASLVAASSTSVSAWSP